MKEIFCLAEHRRGELRAISFEVLSKARQLGEQLAPNNSHTVRRKGRRACQEAFVICRQSYGAGRRRLGEFNQALYQRILCPLIKEQKPVAFVMDIGFRHGIWPFTCR